MSHNGIWRFAETLDAPAPLHRISLGEGHTPLVRSRRLGRAVGIENLYFKLDSCNPSGSYKDRFAASAVSHMLATGKKRIIATSSGNTGAALAAYAAAAGIACEIAIVEQAPLGKLSQMLAYGAQIFRVEGFGIDAGVSGRVIKALHRLGEQPGAQLQISAFKYSPLGMAGVRSISLELAEQCEAPIEHVFTQAGGGGLTWAVAQGFDWLVKRGQLAKSPRVECVQPEGNNTIAGPLRDGLDRGQTITCSSQVSGLQVPTVIDGNHTIAACRASGGTGHAVSDALVFETQRRLAREEGIFCEPAAATAVAGAIQAAAEGWVSRDAVTICLITGIGFKDPAAVERMNADVTCPLIQVEELESRQQ